jgi:deoxyribonucleoside regulator
MKHCCALVSLCIFIHGAVAMLDASAKSATGGRIARNRMRIAWMYFVEGLTQNDIADKLGIGRVTVVRNINEAMESREVKIWIEGEVAECFELEDKLKAAFALKEAIVVPEPSTPDNITKSIGYAAGMYISGKLADGLSIGVGWGATLQASLQTLASRKYDKLEVVSLLGGVVEARKFNPAEFAWAFARTVGADCFLLPAPAIVDSPATREALIERCGLNDVMRRADGLDLAILSVGNMTAASTVFRFNMVTEAERADLITRGAVGDLLFNFYGRDGRIVDHEINSRVMSIPIERLKKVPIRLIASGGHDKVASLLGAITLVDCNVLITNEETARELLAGV